MTHIALVPYQVSIDPSLLTRVAAALQRQVREQFGPLWQIDATVSPFVDWNAVPADYVRLIVVDHLDSTALGVHASRDGQPYALVNAHGDWPLVASHELLEMLADPTGQLTRRGPSPKNDGREVEILVEVCDPCQGARWSYKIDGIPVSDFCTPSYYSAGAAPWSYRGNITAAHQVLKDGYLIWHDPVGQQWWRRDCLGSAPTDYALGPMPPSVSFLRGHIDRITKTHRNAKPRRKPLAAPVAPAARARSRALAHELDAILELSGGPSPRPAARRSVRSSGRTRRKGRA